MADLLAVDALRAGYGDAVVIDGVSLTLGAGQVLALLGRNGAGKTTLIDTLAGATRHHGGSIVLDGIGLVALPAHRRAGAGIGWVPQERNIFASLTVQENLDAVARRGHWNADAVYRLFPRLAERRRHPGRLLSGGEQQMLAFGRALVVNPRLLLLDEPLEGLAPRVAHDMQRAIAYVTREEGLAAIVVEQHPQAVLRLADLAVVLDQGRVVHAGTAQSLLQAPAVLERWLGVGDR